MPILRSGSKRRSRADLSVEMISAPLADFRHTMHIGRGGDAFGDTSFLSTKPEPISQGVQSKNGLLMHKFPGSKQSLLEKSTTDAARYKLQANSTSSLPYMNDNNNTTVCLPKSTSSSFPEVNGLKKQSIEVNSEEQNFKELNECSAFSSLSAGVMKPAESILSLHIDLGPSMLEDVLSVMDRNGFSPKEVNKQNTGKDWTQDLDMSYPLYSAATSSSVKSKEKAQNRSDSTMNSAPHSTTPRVTSSATTCNTHSILSPTSGATPITYSTVFSTTPSTTCATGSTLSNSIPSTRESTTHIASINDEDFLFMDEDDDEIRV